MGQDVETGKRVLREFNSSTLDDVGPLTTLSGISPESGTEDRSRLSYGRTRSLGGDHPVGVVEEGFANSGEQMSRNPRAGTIPGRLSWGMEVDSC
jgi:hypothetical protein